CRECLRHPSTLGSTSDGGAGSFGSFAANDASADDTRQCGDLHTIVNGAGFVIETCPPDQGCAGAKCIPACDAAAAGKQNVGWEFVVATPGFGTTSGCFAVLVANNWNRPTQITVERDGAPSTLPCSVAIPDAWPSRRWMRLSGTPASASHVA